MEENFRFEPGERKIIFIEETGLDESDVKGHYRDLAINMWESWHHFRKEMEKILFFGGTVFLTIISATGLFSAFTKNEIADTFHIYHIIIFHFIFLIIYLAHSYKKLICDTAFAIANRADEYYQKRYKKPLDNKFIFISVKNKFTKDGRILLDTFNYLIIAVYILITAFPFINITENDIVVKWNFIYVLVCFSVVLLVVHFYSKREINKVKLNIAREWQQHIKEFES